MQAGTINSYLATPLGFVIGFVALWCAICYLISFLTGWRALVQRFTKSSEPLGETHTAGPFFYTVYMRFWSHYSSVIRITSASDALYLSVLFPFRIGHPPLRIPWDEIKLNRARRYFIAKIELTLGNQEKIPMRISPRMARNLGILDRVPS
ncbi:MAG: hypothetical protein WBA18_22845 [Terracidiphilus sp.]